MKKILTTQIREEICYVLVCRLLCTSMFPEEQKGCHSATRGTGNLMHIDQHMKSIYYKKAYDMVQQPWIVRKCTRYSTKS